MSLKKVHDELQKDTPGGKSSLSAWIMTFFLEGIAHLGLLPMLLAMVALLYSVGIGLAILIHHFA